MSSKAIGYAAAPVPSAYDARYLLVEFGKIAASINALAAGHIAMTYATPERPREGDIRLADGTQWNPGAGAGVYCYYGSTWNRLG